MQNFFVGEIVGSLGKKAKNRKWRHWVVIHAAFDLTVETFNSVIQDLHPEDYLFYDDHEELTWSDDHSGYKLIKEFKARGLELYSVESADLVYLFPDRNW